MPRFAMLECTTWDDPEFKGLSADAKVLFLWAWTNPDATICGLYEVSMRKLGRVVPDPGAALEELAEKPFLLYDEENEVLWVVNRVKYANRSPKTARAMQHEVTRCPDSPLLVEFVRRYGNALDIRLEN